MRFENADWEAVSFIGCILEGLVSGFELFVLVSEGNVETWVSAVLSLTELSLVLVHLFLELRLPAWFEVEIISGDDVIWDVSNVHQDHDHIGLFFTNVLLLFLSICTVILVSILNQSLSLIDESTNVLELLGIDLVREDLIPWSSLHGESWHILGFNSMNGVRVIVGEAEVVSHVFVLLDELIGLGELDGLEEVWKILINLDSLALEGETPLLQVLSE